MKIKQQAKNSKKITTICPIKDEPCLNEGCALYNDRATQCAIQLLAYNAYRLCVTLEASLSQEQEPPKA
ncbi:MAG: hypothetical protein HQK57_00025 [Deltaproteobacteria bacterium]|nr:hypothetical protein [Deltaproteobacteria bacterium]